MVVGQIGQSIDGRIATVTGHSKYINGPDGLAHLHRLRALVDAVVIGIGTAIADDPQLTVRRVAGPQPARVVIDPRRQASRRRPDARAPMASRRLVITGRRRQTAAAAGRRDCRRCPAPTDEIAPAAILAALAERGLRRILIEGGADTVSRFLRRDASTGCT